jgi:outer membrane protein, heavy metal efflux system
MHLLRKSFGFVIGSLFLAAAPPVGAAPTPATAAPPKSGQPLTLAEALARAEAASPLIRRARAERLAVAARDVGASLLLPSNPVVSGAAGPRRDPAGNGLEFLLHAEQTIEIGGQRSARRALVSRAVRTAELREQVARAETVARVRAAYVGAQLARARVETEAAREALVTKLLDAVQNRVQGGASSDVDLELARLERGIARRAQADAALAATDALARLRLLVGLPAARPITLEAAIVAPSSRSTDLQALIARAETHRAELAVIGAGQDELDADIVRLRREAIPSPTLFVDLERDLPGQVYLGAGLAVPIPVWRRQQGELAVARAERSRLDEERSLAGRDVALEVERAFDAESAQRQMAELLDREVLPSADRAVTLMTEGWRAGKFDLFRLVQTSRDASEARRLYLETLGRLWDATINLDRAVGAE